ncbi:hypothetical protein HDU81_008744 [Chytriomyces hyalinus]|nr:hypothetical protein HDU81_008744 [Chytriomyces hyalinus]
MFVCGFEKSLKMMGTPTGVDNWLTGTDPIQQPTASKSTLARNRSRHRMHTEHHPSAKPAHPPIKPVKRSLSASILSLFNSSNASVPSLSVITETGETTVPSQSNGLSPLVPTGTSPSSSVGSSSHANELLNNHPFFQSRLSLQMEDECSHEDYMYSTDYIQPANAAPAHRRKKVSWRPSEFERVYSGSSSSSSRFSGGPVRDAGRLSSDESEDSSDSDQDDEHAASSSHSAEMFHDDEDVDDGVYAFASHLTQLTQNHPHPTKVLVSRKQVPWFKRLELVVSSFLSPMDNNAPYINPLEPDQSLGGNQQIPFAFYRNGLYASVANPKYRDEFGCIMYTVSVTLLRINIPNFGNDDPLTLSLERRYTDFRRLFLSLKHEYNNEIPAWPDFPPKSYFKRFNSTTIRHRVSGFSSFLTFIVLHSQLYNSSQFLAFLNIH